MAESLAAELARRCAGSVTPDADLSGHTTLKVGGPAAALVEAAGDADLAAVGAVCVERDLPWLIVGRGSNLLVADRGWPGVAVVLGRAYRGLEIDGTRVRAAAAEPMPSLAVRIARAGLGGFAWAVAVPGSMGGAVRMNAGAHDHELAECLVSAELVRMRSGDREVWATADLGLGYRHSELPDDAVVAAATLELEHADADAVEAEIDEVRAWRREHQPLHQPNCGSVFANPEAGTAAGRLLESAGAKELAVGGARVSEQHANFIVTGSGATAADVRRLIARMRRLVAEAHGVELQTEVVMVGDFGDAAEAATGSDPAVR